MWADLRHYELLNLLQYRDLWKSKPILWPKEFKFVFLKINSFLYLL